jgi:hypothetical protein
MRHKDCDGGARGMPVKQLVGERSHGGATAKDEKRARHCERDLPVVESEGWSS